YEPAWGRKLIVHWNFLPVASVDCWKTNLASLVTGFVRRTCAAKVLPRTRASGPAARCGAANFRRLLRQQSVANRTSEEEAWCHRRAPPLPRRFPRTRDLSGVVGMDRN